MRLPYQGKGNGISFVSLLLHMLYFDVNKKQFPNLIYQKAIK